MLSGDSGRGKRLTCSEPALVCCSLGLYMITQLYPLSNRVQRCILAEAIVGIAFDCFKRCWSGLWSDVMMNWRPNNYCQNLLTANTIVRQDESTQFFSAGLSQRDTKATSCSSLLVPRWARTTPSPCEEASRARSRSLSESYCTNRRSDVSSLFTLSNAFC